MRRNDDEFAGLRIGSLTTYQTEIVFLCIAPLLFLYVVYQISVGRDFTKLGPVVLEPGMLWAWLALEFGATILGIVRGFRMTRR